MSDGSTNSSAALEATGNIENSPDAMQCKAGNTLHVSEKDALSTAQAEAVVSPSTEHKQKVEELLKLSKLEEAVEEFGFYMEARIGEVELGSMNPALAEDYARYGSLLLRLAIKNNDQNLLASQNAVPSGANSSVTEALLQSVADGRQKLIELDEDEEEQAEEEEKQEGQEDAASGEEDEKEPEESADEKKPIDPVTGEEEDDDFAIAWENLDLARILFATRIEETADQAEKARLTRSLAMVLQDLGDLSLENESFDQATSDYEEALKAFGQNPSPEVFRDVAGVYFNLALSMEFLNRIEEARAMYTHCKEFLERQESHLIASETASAVDNSSVAAVGEVRALIEEVRTKIDDLATTNQATLSEAVLNATTLAAASAAQSLSGAVAVNDLTSMIKKRRSEPAASDAEAKAAKTEADLEDKTE